MTTATFDIDSLDIDEELGLNSKWSIALARAGFMMTEKQTIPPPPCVTTLYFTSPRRITVNEVVLFRDNEIHTIERMSRRYLLQPWPLMTTLILHVEIIIRP